MIAKEGIDEKHTGMFTIDLKPFKSLLKEKYSAGKNFRKEEMGKETADIHIYLKTTTEKSSNLLE